MESRAGFPALFILSILSILFRNAGRERRGQVDATEGRPSSVRIGYHASHEQFAPSELLRLAVQAERAGFEALMSSDHLAPWSARQGESGFAWSWLPVALSATSLPALQVTTPVGWRYHPAVVAQAAATVAEMFPGRLALALGSGEALNEHVVGERWPSKAERNARLLAAAEILRALFAGETVSRAGPIVVDRAKLWTRPPVAPPLLGLALSPETARFAATWADGLVTLRAAGLARVVEAFRAEAPEKPVFVQMHVSYAPTEQEALAAAMDQWRTNALPRQVTENLATVEEFDALLPLVREEDVRKSVLVSAEPEEHAAALRELAALGTKGVYVHPVGRDQERAIQAYARGVLPGVRPGMR